MFSLDQFFYDLPPERIAHSPLDPRDSSKLLHLNRETGAIEHRVFRDLPQLLRPTDVLVRNNTKVLPARIFGQKSTGGHCEILLVRQLSTSTTSCEWECLTKPGLKPGQVISFPDSELTATCQEITNFTRTLSFNTPLPRFFETLQKIGHTPIPPYIEWEKHDELKLREVYQTTFAKITGSVAAPTAGLHFTPAVDDALRAKGITIEEVTLHVGLGTFLPVQEEQIAAQKLHQEQYVLAAETATRLTQAKQAGRRLVAVGTTTTRVLETCAKVTSTGTEFYAGAGDTQLFIQPGYQFNAVDALITNFHLPKSSLLMLVSAFVSQPNTQNSFSSFAESTVGQAYQVAIENDYRFFSFGDAMFIE